MTSSQGKEESSMISLKYSMSLFKEWISLNYWINGFTMKEISREMLNMAKGR